jgi:hypothetical protein
MPFYERIGYIAAMKNAEAKSALPTLIDGWAEATSQPMPPDGTFHYGFGDFWTWLQNNHPSYTKFKATPNARWVMEMWFDKEMKQAWRN